MDRSNVAESKVEVSSEAHVPDLGIIADGSERSGSIGRSRLVSAITVALRLARDSAGNDLLLLREDAEARARKDAERELAAARAEIDHIRRDQAGEGKCARFWRKATRSDHR